MKTIGVIGGIGPQATIDFERRVHLESQKALPPDRNKNYPPLWVYYMREAPVKIGKDGEAIEPLAPADKLIDIARQLGEKCDFLVIASNTPHFFIKEITEAAGKQVLNMVDMVVEKIRKEGFRKVGIMATSATIKNGLYHKPLNRHGVETEVLSDIDNEELDKGIFKVMEGREGKEDRTVAVEGVKYLKERDCDAIIMGCTEVPFLLEGLAEEKYFINPIQILAEASVKFAADY